MEKLSIKEEARKQAEQEMFSQVLAEGEARLKAEAEVRRLQAEADERSNEIKQKAEEEALLQVV